MAGLDFNVTHNLKLELGYRFLDYGKFNSGGAHCVDRRQRRRRLLRRLLLQAASKELTSNDFRIGLRYYLDEPPRRRREAPLVRKY